MGSAAARVLALPKGQKLDRVSGMVLAAGHGHRMRPYTEKTPKPLLPILNCPLLVWNLSHMARSGISDIAVNTHHLSPSFSPVSELSRNAGLSVHFHHEVHLTGPVGGVLACRPMLAEGHDIVVLAGDGLYGANLPAMLAHHREQGATLTLGLSAVTDGSRYGVLETNPDGTARSMLEKVRGVGATANASCGIYILSSQLLGRLEASSVPIDWVDIVRAMLARGELISTYRASWWLDAGTPQDILAHNLAGLESNVLHSIANQVSGSATGSLWASGSVAKVTDIKIIGRVLVDEDVKIGAYSSLEWSVVGPGARIGKNVILKHSVILPGAAIPDDTHVIGKLVS